MPTQTPTEPNRPIEAAAPPKIHRVEVEWHAVTYKTVIVYALLLIAIILAGTFILFPNFYSAVTRKISTITSNEGETDRKSVV